MDPDYATSRHPSSGDDGPDPRDEHDADFAHGSADGRRARGPRKTLAELLTEIGADESRESISLNDLIVLLGGRGRAALIMIFAFPNVLPGPPGFSSVLAVPLLYLSFQMMLGRKPWLPKIIGERALSREKFAKLVERLSPWLARSERLLHQRWPALVQPPAENILGALFMILAAVLILPIPLGNMLPAFSMCLVSLGILGRDGVWVTIGTFVAFLSLIVAGGVAFAIVKSAIFVLMNAFG